MGFSQCSSMANAKKYQVKAQAGDDCAQGYYQYANFYAQKCNCDRALSDADRTRLIATLNMSVNIINGQYSSCGGKLALVTKNSCKGASSSTVSGSATSSSSSSSSASTDNSLQELKQSIQNAQTSINAVNKIENGNVVGGALDLAGQLQVEGLDQLAGGVAIAGVIGQIAYENKQRKIEEAKRVAEQQKIAQENQRIEALRLAKIKVQQLFMNTIKDNAMPLIQESGNYSFFIVSKLSNNKIGMSKFNMYKSSNNDLPYKKDIVEAYKKETAVGNVNFYGPFSSESEFNDYKKLAEQSFIQVKEVYFEAQKKSSQLSTSKKNNAEYDVWGNKIKSKTEKTTTESDFWD